MQCWVNPYYIGHIKIHLLFLTLLGQALTISLKNLFTILTQNLDSSRKPLKPYQVFLHTPSQVMMQRTQNLRKQKRRGWEIHLKMWTLSNSLQQLSIITRRCLTMCIIITINLRKWSSRILTVKLGPSSKQTVPIFQTIHGNQAKGEL